MMMNLKNSIHHLSFCLEQDEDKKEKDKKRDKDKDKKREKLRFCTGDPDLLMAFVYFDQNHTGYLLDKDVEEILHTIGLHLSRAQVQIIDEIRYPPF